MPGLMAITRTFLHLGHIEYLIGNGSVASPHLGHVIRPVLGVCGSYFRFVLLHLAQCHIRMSFKHVSCGFRILGTDRDRCPPQRCHTEDRPNPLGYYDHRKDMGRVQAVSDGNSSGQAAS